MSDNWNFTKVCSKCEGTGLIGTKLCKKCSGEGATTSDKLDFKPMTDEELNIYLDETDPYNMDEEDF